MENESVLQLEEQPHGEDAEVENKRKYLRLTLEQRTQLERAFVNNSTPNEHERSTLANQLNMNATRVKYWFQNRRTKFKRNRDQVRIQNAWSILEQQNARLNAELNWYRQTMGLPPIPFNNVIGPLTPPHPPSANGIPQPMQAPPVLNTHPNMSNDPYMEIPETDDDIPQVHDISRDPPNQ